jgi:hypothetical protein
MEFFHYKFHYPVGLTLKFSRSSRQHQFYQEIQLVVLDADFTGNSFLNREGHPEVRRSLRNQLWYGGLV